MTDPMWREIAEDLRRKIESGELGHDGQPLPSELDLRGQYRVSRNTIRDAIKWLSARGLLISRPGKGTFVTQEVDPFVTTLRTEVGAGPNAETAAYRSEAGKRTRTPRPSIPRVEIHQAAGLVADQLELAEGVNVVSRHQERFIEGMPYSLRTTFYPMRLVDMGASRLLQAVDLPAGVVAYIEDALGITQAGWRDTFTVRAPDMLEAGFFNLPDDGRVAVIEIIRTGYDESGQPFRVTVATYPADRNQLVMTVGKVPAKRHRPDGHEAGMAGSRR